MSTNFDKEELVYNYLKDAYNIQKDIITQIDARLGNYLLIIGLMLTISSYYASQIILLYNKIPLIYFVIGLIIYILPNIFLIISLLCLIKIFYICKFFLPFINDEALKTLIKMDDSDVDLKILFSDLSNNYLNAYRNNMYYLGKRSKISELIKNSMLFSVVFFVIFLTYLLTIKIYFCNLQTEKQVKTRVVKERSDNNMKDSGNSDLNQPKETEPKPVEPSAELKPTQPSAQGNPEVIELGESKENIKKVILDNKKYNK